MIANGLIDLFVYVLYEFHAPSWVLSVNWVVMGILFLALSSVTGVTGNAGDKQAA
jgi:hypothetical protein